MSCDRCGQRAQGRLCATCTEIEAMEDHWEAKRGEDAPEEVSD
ncbi:hypothetical protein [Halobaculum sp. EA56]